MRGTMLRASVAECSRREGSMAVSCRKKEEATCRVVYLGKGD